MECLGKQVGVAGEARTAGRGRARQSLGWGLVIVAVVTAACSSDNSGSTASPTAGPVASTTSVVPVPLALDGVEVLDGCEWLDPRSCHLPFPSDVFTVADDSTDTGRRVAFDPDRAAFNSEGTAVDVTEWNRNDGFSPGSLLLFYAPTADLVASGAAPITDLTVGLSDTSAVVIVDAETGERHPHWVEFDSLPESDDDRLLQIRPATNFEEGHRYVVGVRHLVDADGAPLVPSEPFRAYRDGLDTGIEAMEARRPQMESVFETLTAVGVDRSELFLAWDFTVASERNLSERLLHIRDDAFDQLGDVAPTFTVDEVIPAEENDAEHVAFFVEGTFDVPLYLTGSGESGTRFSLGDDGLPLRNPDVPTYAASFGCTIPNAAIADSADPARPVVYGHGLLGSHGEVRAGNIRRMTDEHNMVYCATDWIGMSEDDIVNAATILNDLGRFPTLVDRSQQGILNTLFLGRLLGTEDGLASDPAFQVEGRSILDTSEVFYDGNSQGAIMGGAATAVSNEWSKAVLGVPGMNYSTLLDRSVDFDQFAPLSQAAYPDPVDRRIGFAMAQMLWDRAETNGYAHHLTDDPLPGTQPHQILMHVAFGDFQVADVTAFVQARTAGAMTYHAPLLDDARGRIDYAFGLEPTTYPSTASVVVMWDADVPPPPLTNTTPTGEGDPSGEPHDPHEDPRSQESAREQKSQFLSPAGEIVDVCDALPCLAER